MESGLNQGHMKEKASTFLKFDKMITPGIIRAIYYIGLGLGVFFGLMMVLRGLNPYGSGAEVLIGLIFMVVAPLFVRVWCELTIVIFKINEALQVIKNK